MQNKFLLSPLHIIDIAEDGKGVAKHEDLVIFVEKAIPGDVVSANIFRKKKKFAEAKMEELLESSPYRVLPHCSHFGVCGGCKWQHLNYEAQLQFKQKTVLDALQRIGGMDVEAARSIIPSAGREYYRNKLEFTFSNKRWLTDVDISKDEIVDRNALGFHVPLRFDKILDIEHCYLQGGISNDLRNEVRSLAQQNEITFYDLRLHEGCLRNLIVRTSSTGEAMVIVVFAYPKEGDIDLMMNGIARKFPQISALMYIVNQKKNDTTFDQEVVSFRGNGYIFEEMALPDGNNKVRFKISPKSFYQTNSAQAERLYKEAFLLAGFRGNELVYDLYTGAGTIANYIASSVKKVIGIEYVPEAIEDAKSNSILNNISNTLFFAGDMKNVLTTSFVEQHGVPDVIITDPPRAGMHEDVVNKILEILPKKVVYISCNAATQARDLVLLKTKYSLKAIQPVDMFPHTQHVENIVLLELIG